MGRNILMNSQLKRILFMSSDKKKWNKTEKDRKNMEKENNTNESDFSENEIPNLNSLEPFEFEPKSNIGDISSSQKQPSEVFCYKSPDFIKKEALAEVFSCQFCKISKNTFFYRTPLYDCFWVATVMMKKKVLNIK